jgi:hypothetical protein
MSAHVVPSAQPPAQPSTEHHPTLLVPRQLVRANEYDRFARFCRQTTELERREIAVGR